MTEGRARVLTVVSTLGIGGTERVAQNLAVGYGRHGFESAVLAFAAGGPRATALADAGLPVFTPDQQSDPLRSAVAWNPELIHVHRAGHRDPASGAVLLAIKEAADVPVIETNVFGRPDYSSTSALIDVHAHVSMWSAWRWRQWARGLRCRGTNCLLPNACDVSTFSRTSPAERAALRAELGLPEDAYVVGRVGQPSESKWSSHTVVSFQMLARQLEDAWLVLVGPPPSIRRQVDALSPVIRRRVRLVDPRPSDGWLKNVYSALDVFLHSSRIGESFGMVLVESMASETPVVTLATPLRDNGQYEVVGDALGGAVVRDTAEAAKTLAVFAADRSVRVRLGHAGRARVTELYDLPVVQRRAAAIIDAVLAGEKRSLQDRLDAALGVGLERAILRGLGDIPEPSPGALVAHATAQLPLHSRAALAALHHPWPYRVAELRSVLRMKRARRWASAR